MTKCYEMLVEMRAMFTLRQEASKHPTYRGDRDPCKCLRTKVNKTYSSTK